MYSSKALSMTGRIPSLKACTMRPTSSSNLCLRRGSHVARYSSDMIQEARALRPCVYASYLSNRKNLGVRRNASPTTQLEVIGLSMFISTERGSLDSETMNETSRDGDERGVSWLERLATRYQADARNVNICFPWIPVRHNS